MIIENLLTGFRASIPASKYRGKHPDITYKMHLLNEFYGKASKNLASQSFLCVEEVFDLRKGPSKSSTSRLL